MVRTQVQLTEKQFDTIRRVASREGVSMAEVIRRALDRVTESELMPDRDELKRRAIAAIGAGHADKTDLSSKHDDYLAEAYSE
ncbi:MAG: ribbon-helix-helix protein, CopG family [Armatimonadota bacterium]|nr:ribbon-helix-helix protein, CopG family [Armatimonadota bacterium]